MRPDEHNPHAYDPHTDEWTCACGRVYRDEMYGSHCPSANEAVSCKHCAAIFSITAAGRSARAAHETRCDKRRVNAPRPGAGPSDEEVAAAIASIQGVT